MDSRQFPHGTNNTTQLSFGSSVSKHCATISSRTLPSFQEHMIKAFRMIRLSMTRKLSSMSASGSCIAVIEERRNCGLSIHESKARQIVPLVLRQLLSEDFSMRLRSQGPILMSLDLLWPCGLWFLDHDDYLRHRPSFLFDLCVFTGMSQLSDCGGHTSL